MRHTEARLAYFDPAIAAFFEGLERNNTRTWFTAHRDEYDELVQAPLDRLTEEATRRYGPGRVMRPNRDVRFSKDKRPYRTSGAMTAGEIGGVYLEVDAGGISVGGGLYGPSRDQLRRARAAIAAVPSAAEALGRATGALERQGFELAGPPLKTAPRGYATDHPEIELLRLTHYAGIRRLPISAERKDVLAAWRAVEPLLDWVRDRVGPARSWP